MQVPGGLTQTVCQAMCTGEKTLYSAISLSHFSSLVGQYYQEDQDRQGIQHVWAKQYNTQFWLDNFMVRIYSGDNSADGMIILKLTLVKQVV